jgi:hypothetical protein
MMIKTTISLPQDDLTPYKDCTPFESMRMHAWSRKIYADITPDLCHDSYAIAETHMLVQAIKEK